MILRASLALALIVAASGCSMPKEPTPLRELLSKVVGPSRRQLVGQMFESPDPDVRRQAVERLASHEWGRKDPYLKAYALLAEDPAPTVRSVAVRALGLGGDPKYLDKVLAALKDSEPSVRCDAAAALDSIVDPRAVEALSNSAVSDPVADVRVGAIRALRHYRSKAVLETLMECLRDPEFAVRFRAGETLHELTGETAAPDPAAWREALAGKADPFVAPAKPRRWWQRRRRAKPTTTQPARMAGGRRRTWWDWFGLFDKRQPSDQPAGRAGSQPASTSGER